MSTPKMLSVWVIQFCLCFYFACRVYGVPIYRTEMAYPAPLAVATEINDLIDAFVPSVLAENSSLTIQEALCSYMNGKLAALSSQGKMTVTGINFTAGPVGGVQLEGSVLPGYFVCIPDIFNLTASVGVDSIPLAKVTYQCDTMQITASSQTYGNHTILPDLLQLQDLRFSFASNFTSYLMSFEGDWAIANTNMKIVMNYIQATRLLEVTGGLNGSGPSIESIVTELTGQTLPLSGQYASTYRNIKIAGVTDGQSSGTIILAVSFNSNSQVYVVLNKNESKLNSAVAVEVASIRLSELIEDITGYNISSFPYFGSLVLPEIGLSISMETISSPLIQECFNDSYLLSFNGNTIPADLVGYVDFDFASSPFKLTHSNASVLFGVMGHSFTVGNIFDVISLTDFDLPPGIDSIEKLKIRDFALHLLARTITVQAELEKSLSYFDGILEIGNPLITITVGLETGNVSFEISGYITLAGTKIHMMLTYIPATGLLEVTGGLNGAGPSIESIVTELTGQTLPLSGQYASTYRNIKIAGVTDGQSSGTIILAVSFNSNSHVYVVLNKNESMLNSAIAVDLASSRFSSLIHDVTGYDISSLPYFGSLVLPEIGLSISSEAISSPLIQECFNNSYLLSCYGDTIPAGVLAYIDVSFVSSPLILTYSDNGVLFKVKDDFFTIGNLLEHTSIVNLPTVKLPPSIDNIGGLSVRDFVLDVVNNTITVQVEFGTTLRYFHRLLEIENPMITLEVSLPSGDVALEVSGDITIAGTEFTINIAQAEGSKYVLEAFSDSIMFSSMITAFAARLLPVPLEAIASSLPFLNFDIKDASLVLPLETGFSQIFLSGKPVIAGFTIIHMSATIIDQDGDVKIAVGFELGNPNLAHILGQIAPIASSALRLIPFLDQEIDTDIIIAPEDLVDVSLVKEDLHNLILKRGITVRAAIPFPSDSKCGMDPFCKVVKLLLPADTVLNIDSTIISPTSFNLVASLVGDIDIPGGLTITQAGMEIRAGEDTSIGIVGTISFLGIDFTTRVYASASGVVIQMIAAGCWQNAFFIPILDICNIQGSVGFGSTMITELSLGAEVRIGVGSCSKLTAVGYIGLNTMEPRNNYYYATFPQGLTLSALLGALCINTNAIPSPIANTGLQPGFKSSFTAGPLGKSIPEIGLYIPPGLNLNGTVNILGLEATCNISVSPTEGLYVAIALPPISVGNLLHMYASSSDQSRGPYLIADLRSSRISVEASGYLSVLGISVESTLSISQQSMSLSFHGSILGIVDASITLSAPLIGSFSSAEFQVSGSFSSNIFEIVEDAIRDAADITANAASSALGAAQDLVDLKREALQAASRGLESARGTLSSVQRRFDEAVREVNKLIDRVDGICRIRSCGSICVPGCGGCSCSWSGCGCRCSSCYSRVTDPECQAANLACRALKAPIELTLKVARETFRAAGDSLDIAKEAFRAAEFVFDTASDALETVTKGLEEVKDVFRVGIELIGDIDSFGLTGLFSLDEITFESSLSAASGGSFSLTVQATILGNTETLRISVNLNDFVETITRPLADKVCLGLGDLL